MTESFSCKPDRFKPAATWWPRVAQVLKWLYKAGKFAFALLLGGYVFVYLSNALGFIAFIANKHFNTDTLHHVAWVTGVVVTAIGIPLGWVKVCGLGGNWSKTEPAEPTETAPPAKPPKQVRGIAGNAGFFALLGLIAGISVSSLLVMAWFSISLSPFAPKSWSTSVQPISHSSSDDMMSDDAGGGFESSHPTLRRLFWMPSAILVGIGLATGAVVGAIDKIRKNNLP